MASYAMEPMQQTQVFAPGEPTLDELEELAKRIETNEERQAEAIKELQFNLKNAVVSKPPLQPEESP